MSSRLPLRPLVGLWLMVTCTTATLSANEAAPPLVAMGSFECDSGTYEGLQATRDLSDRLQAALSQLESFQLVEPEQLDLVYEELSLIPMAGSRQRDLLRAGRRLGADWIVLGLLEELEPGIHALKIEVVHAGEADVLATTSVAAIAHAGAGARARPQFDLIQVAERVRSVLTDAARQSQANRAASLVIMPIHFECISRAGRLDHVREDFLLQLRQLAGADPGLRVVTYPTIAATRDKAGPGLEGVVQWPRDADRSGTPPLFLWGGFEEAADGATPFDQVTVSATVWLWDGTGEPVAVGDEAPVAGAGELNQRLIETVLRRAAELEHAPEATPDSLAAVAATLVEQGDQRMDEFRAARGTLPRGDERLATLGQLALDRYRLAVFLTPDDPALQRQLVLAKSEYHYSGPIEDHYMSYPATWELNRALAEFETRFPDAVDPEDVVASVGIAQLLIQDRIFRDVPQRYPRDRRQLYSERIQRQHVERLSRLDPGFFDLNTNIAEFAMQGHAMLTTPEDRARFFELLWPSYVAHRSTFRQNVQEDERWQTTLKEVFEAVGRPETATALLALPVPGPRSGARLDEPMFPEDLRFEARRVDVLPPLLEVAPTMLGKPDSRSVVTSLLFDGDTLLAGIDRGSIGSWAGDQYEKRQSYHAGRSYLAALRADASGARLEQLRESPSTITSMVVGGDHLWLGTRLNGVLQLDRGDHGLVHEWTTQSGLPTDFVRGLAWHDGRLIAGGGYQKEGQLFAVTPGESGAVALPLVRPVGADGEVVGDETPAIVRRIAFAHDRSVVLVGNPNAYLTADGHDQDHAVDLGAKAMTGTSRHGPDAHAGHVFTVVPDEGRDGGWWLGTSAGLAWASADGEHVRQWAPPRGAHMFEQRGWVPYMRRTGRLKQMFEVKTRLAGVVISLAVDGEFVYMVTTTQFDGFQDSDPEGEHLMVLHAPSNRWVGRVKLPDWPTVMAQDDTRLWIGMLGDEHLLMQFSKEELTATPEHEWVDDSPGADEIAAARAGLGRSERASYAFFDQDYEQVAQLLGDMPADELTLGERFLLAFSYDEGGLNRPHEARRLLEMILAMELHTSWRHEATAALEALDKAEDGEGGDQRVQ